MAVRIFPPSLSLEVSPSDDTQTAQGCLKRRPSTISTSGRNNIPSWKLHLLDLVMKVPKATPVHCIDPSGIFRLSFSRNDSKDSTSTGGNATLNLSRCTLTTDIDIDGEKEKGAAPTPSPNYLHLERTKEERELMESRIKSLRLEIGDLSIAENLERLCDHYFKLDKYGTLQRLEVENSRGESVSVAGPNTSPYFVADFRKAFPRNAELSKSQTQSPMTPDTQGVESETTPTPRKKKSVKIANPYWANISLAQSPLFHGLLTKRQTEKLLKSEGQFLVRHLMHEPGFILSFNFNGCVHNFRVIEEGGLFYLEDRKTCYGSLEEMANDGLRSLYLDIKAGAYVDIMTELAQINKHDSMISWLSPSSSSSSGRNSRKSSAVGFFSRQVSVLSPVSSVLENDPDQELNEHWFAPGISPVKKSICEICHLKQKGSFSFKSPAMAKTMLTCRDCGMTIHEDCLIKVDSDCTPKLTKLPGIFGTDLTTIVKACDKSKPPFVITKCIEEIEKRGLGSEGIYRVSGAQDAVQSLQTVFETDREKASLDFCEDINSICGVLKLYLRLLPDPLITKDVFEHFFSSNSESSTLSVDSVRIGMELLPPAHKMTLKYLVKHLARVSQLRDSNKMSSYNLSSVLAPSIIVPEEMSLNVLKVGTDLVDILIRNAHEVYPK